MSRYGAVKHHKSRVAKRAMEQLGNREIHVVVALTRTALGEYMARACVKGPYSHRKASERCAWSPYHGKKSPTQAVKSALHKLATKLK